MSEKWTVLHFPALNEAGEALWPERYSAEYLEQTKRVIGPYDWESLYMGRPYQRGGKYVKTDRIRFVEPDLVPRDLQPVRVIDVATTSSQTADFSVSLKVAKVKEKGIPSYWILDGWHLRAEWPSIRERVIQDAQVDGPSVLIYMEAQAGFMAAYQDLKNELAGTAMVEKVTVRKDKLARALSWITAIEAGQVCVVRSPASSGWQEEFLRQLQAFPSKNTHDDFPDALSIFMQVHGAGRGSIAVRW